MSSGEIVKSAPVLRNLAKDLLTQEENEVFKNALQTYRTSRSLTNLVTQLILAVTSTEKLMLLIELGRILPEHIKGDFHKLCCLHFPKYSSFVNYFNPNTNVKRNQVISKDTSGHFQVVSTGVDQSIFLNLGPTDQRSLQAESGIDVNSDVDDISRHGGDANGGNLGSSWKIENRSLQSRSNSNRGSVSSQVNADRVTSPSTTPKGSVSSANQMSWKQSHSSLPQEQVDGGIRNRARSLRMLSGSLPSVLASPSQQPSPSLSRAAGEEKARILLKRKKDGSLGLGVRGGKEYNTPIEVFKVEPGSQGHMQGLQVGDRILDVNGTDFTNLTHTEAVMAMRNAWNIIMTVQKQKEDPLTLGGMTYRSNTSFDDVDVLVYPTKKGKLGCGVYRDAVNSLMIRNVEKNSPASKAGIHKGDRIVEIDGLKVASLTDKQVAIMTRVKRVRMKVHRQAKTMSVGTQDNLSDHPDFNDIFSSFSHEFSHPNVGDLKDDDCATFVSSTPRVRAASEERQPPSTDLDPSMRPRSASQVRPTSLAFSTNEELDQLPSPLTPPQTPPKMIHHDPSPQQQQQQQQQYHRHHQHQKQQQQQYQQHQQQQQQQQQRVVMPNGRHSVSVRGRRPLSPMDSDSIDDNYIIASQPSYQQRMYKPRMIMSAPMKPASSNSYSPSLNHKSNAKSSSNKPLGRYISKSEHHQTLPSRLAMMYKPSRQLSNAEVEYYYQQQKQQQRHQHQERSRSRKRASSSTTGKMKDIRNRSQSPHSVASQMSVVKRSGSMPAQSRDKEFLKAVQNSMERRQRAQRLSLYQLPDHDDDAWLVF